MLLKQDGGNQISRDHEKYAYAGAAEIGSKQRRSMAALREMRQYHQRD
jgi:Zn-dependent protease with chaperone function